MMPDTGHDVDTREPSPVKDIFSWYSGRFLCYTGAMDIEKLHQIETLIAHQEQRIQDLSDIVAKQWDAIDILKKRLNQMQDKLKNVEEATQSIAKSGDGLSIAESAAMEKPPHY